MLREKQKKGGGRDEKGLAYNSINFYSFSFDLNFTGHSDRAEINHIRLFAIKGIKYIKAD